MIIYNNPIQIMLYIIIDVYIVLIKGRLGFFVVHGSEIWSYILKDVYLDAKFLNFKQGLTLESVGSRNTNIFFLFNGIAIIVYIILDLHLYL